jgi:hypothetical protein
VTEVLSGDYFEPLSTSSPHQIWSAAMVVSPLLRGMLGLTTDATAHTIRLSPHVPYNWPTFSIGNVKAGDCTATLQYQRTTYDISLKVDRIGSAPCTIEFSPGFSLRASIVGAEINGRKVNVLMNRNSQDQHATVILPLTAATNEVRMHVKNDFGVFLDPQLPNLGGASQGLRFVSESWAPDGGAIFNLSGWAGRTYTIGVWNPTSVAKVDGATLDKADGHSQLVVSFPGDGNIGYVHHTVAIHFTK